MEGEFTQLASFLGSYSVTAETLLAAFAVVLAGGILRHVSGLLITKAVERRGGDEHAAASARKVSFYAIYVFTFIAVLGVFGVPLSALGAAVGLIGLGVSFALKDMIANFVSGILILVNRPFKIGDQIEVVGEEGTVRDISIRASEVRTYDGRMVLVPNSDLYNGTVVNKTAYDQRRFDVVVGVSYGSDLRKAKQLAEDILREVEQVEDEPGPQVLVSELGDSSIKLKLRGWTRSSRSNLLEAASNVTQKVKERFEQEGIEIPFPIRTVHMED